MLDKWKHNLEMNMVPQTLGDIEATLLTLKLEQAKKKGKLFLPIVIPQMTDTEKANPILQREFELANKINEMVNFLNERFSH